MPRFGGLGSMALLVFVAITIPAATLAHYGKSLAMSITV